MKLTKKCFYDYNALNFIFDITSVISNGKHRKPVHIYCMSLNSFRCDLIYEFVKKEFCILDNEL